MVPKPLLALLRGNPLEGETIAFVDAVATLAADNKVPFFPDYTDHGPHHIERVLEDCLRLIPPAVWDAELLGPSDATVLICAVALHDIGMHVRAEGFVELVSGDFGQGPLQWFDTEHARRPADVSWPEAWQAFRTEVRHFTRSQLDRILGPRNAGVPAIAQSVGKLDPDRWTTPDHLIIGEFLRRHHARLAHEIAIYGFPGAGSAFPAAAHKLPDVADAIGLVARSHNEHLRAMVDYCEFVSPGDKRPWDALVPYHMGLLRVADYLQLDAQRAPVVLLNLRAPASRVSIDEWKKHRAVRRISWDHEDPAAIFVGVGDEHDLHTHLQLRTLLDGLQSEMDTTTGLLSETYTASALRPLELSRRRVRTNLDEPSLHERLPYIARGAALRSDDDLFRLFMSDLYGDHPAVAGRELLQNAVDAVRERRRVCGLQPHDPLDGDGRPDVDVFLEQLDDRSSRLTVTDCGIGMTADTVERYFLTAGASFGPTASDFEDVGAEEAAGWMKAGRFGVGVFAAFLLGPEVEVTTRHVSAPSGISFVASLNQDLVRLDKVVDCPVGTTVTVLIRSDLGDGSHAGLGPWHGFEFLEAVVEYYRLDHPGVAFRAATQGNQPVTLVAPADVPASEWQRLPDGWRSVAAPGFDQVLVEVDRPNRGRVVHNGMRIGTPEHFRVDTSRWSHETLRGLVDGPSVAIFDSRHLLGLNLTRFGLKDRHLPFEDALLSTLGRELLVAALSSPVPEFPFLRAQAGTAVLAGNEALPLLPSVLARHGADAVCALWATTGQGSQSLRSCPDERSRSFMKGSSRSGEWSTRVCLTADSTWIPGDGHEWEANVIHHKSREWSLWLGRPILGTVVVDPEEASRYGLPSEWRSVEPRGGASQPSLVGRGEDEVVQRLVDCALELSQLEEGSVALTLFGAPEAESHPDAILAAAWLEQLGGRGVDVRPAQRAEQCERLAAVSTEWREAIERWTRIWAPRAGS